MKNKNMIQILQAKPTQAEELSQIALLSKAYWPYPKDYLEKCRDALALSPQDIQDWPVYIATLQNKIIGFFALKKIKEENRLDHLWILPEYIGKKVGSQLFQKSINEAQKIRWSSFRIAADPYAENFYLKLGAKKIGMIQSRIKPDLYLPHLEYTIR